MPTRKIDGEWVTDDNICHGYLDGECLLEAKDCPFKANVRECNKSNVERIKKNMDKIDFYADEKKNVEEFVNMKEFFKANPKKYDEFIAWYDSTHLTELDKAVNKYVKDVGDEEKDSSAEDFRAGVHWLSDAIANIKIHDVNNDHLIVSDIFNFIEKECK